MESRANAGAASRSRATASSSWRWVVGWTAGAVAACGVMVGYRYAVRGVLISPLHSIVYSVGEVILPW